MEENQEKRRIPWWGWALGCLAIFTALGVVVVIVAAAVIMFVSSRTVASESSRPIDSADLVVVPEDTETPAPTPTDPEETETSVPDTPAPEETAVESESSVPSEESTGNDPNSAERAEIESNVVEIRELSPQQTIFPTVLSQEELRQRLEEEFAEDYSPEEARYDAITLSAFDFLEPDFDLYNFSIDLFTEEIGGFYDPVTDEFVVISNDEAFDVLEQWTHAHEYVHALQDQYFDLEMLDDDSIGSETLFALQAMAEGDATLVQTLYLLNGYFDQEQLFALFDETLSIDTAVLDSAPPVIAHGLEFPYLQGLEFVQTLYDEGGFEAVDQAWQNLPQSSEHILHPERYLAGDEMQDVSLEPLDDLLGEDWELADEDILGEFYLREYLSQQLNDNQVDTAATGWGGDRYSVYWNEAEQSVVMVLKLVWDTPNDADEFGVAYVIYPNRLLETKAEGQEDGGLCWRGDEVICMYELEGSTIIVRAPTLEIAKEVAAVQFS